MYEILRRSNSVSRGVRVYVRSAMWMPGSETALEELMYRASEELLRNCSLVLQALHNSSLRLSATNTIVNPHSTHHLRMGLVQRKTTSQSAPRFYPRLMHSTEESYSGMKSFIGVYTVKEITG